MSRFAHSKLFNGIGIIYKPLNYHQIGWICTRDLKICHFVLYNVLKLASKIIDGIQINIFIKLSIIAEKMNENS